MVVGFDIKKHDSHTFWKKKKKFATPLKKTLDPYGGHVKKNRHVPVNNNLKILANAAINLNTAIDRYKYESTCFLGCSALWGLGS